ncbi:MAG: efflux RND transporter periplasmic adaptor subunit [Polyangiales bacterium]
MSPISQRRSVLPATLALLFATVGGGFALGYFVATRRAPAPSIAAEAPRTSIQHTAVRVRLPESLRPHAGVRVEPLERRRLASTIELSGSVEFNADRVADVGGRVAGRISQVFVRAGDRVARGAPLVTITSATLGELAASALSVRAQLTAARAQLARLTTLASQQLATGVELDEARARVASLIAEQRGFEQRARAMGAHQGASASTGVTLRAPIAGRVIARQATVGQVVDPTETLIRVADLSRVRVMLNVFERNLGRISVGDAVSIRAESHGDREFLGVVSQVAATVERETRTAQVEVHVDNPDEALRQGQFVTARLTLGRAQTREALLVRRSAVILLEGQPTVFVEVEPDVFEPRPVALGEGDDERVELLRGASERERVAVDGVFSLKSELQR